MGPRSAAAIVVATLLLMAGSALAQSEYVLLDCRAELRAGVLERASRLRLPFQECDEATDGYGAWQVELISRNGDLVQIATLGQAVELQHECSAGPVALWPYVLRLYAPVDQLVPTVTEPVDTKTRDGRAVRLRPGVPVHHVKGRWYRVFADGEQVEVGLGKKQLTTTFGDPPSGPCADLEDPVAPETSASDPGPAPPPATWRAPEKAAVYLPTREEIGEVWAPVEFAEEQTFTQGMLRCDTDAVFEWTLAGAAPLCFLELALELAMVEPEPASEPEPGPEAEPLSAPDPADPPPTSDPAP